MARINLLPWRIEERERKNKEFVTMAAAAAALTILGILLVMTFLNNELSNQESTNEMIRNENTRLDGVLIEIEGLEERRNEMVERMRIIQDLQGRRFVPVRVWDDIARSIPQTVYVTGMKREGDVITLSGFAANANAVSELVRNLDATPWLTNSGVPNIQTDVQAYQQLDPASKSTSSNQLQRPMYPEDSYIRFTVTTKVSAEETLADDSQTALPDGTPAVQDTAALPNANAPVNSAPAPTQPAPTQVAEPQSVSTEQPAAPQAGTVAPNNQAPASAPTETVPPAGQSTTQATTGGQ